MSKNRIRWVDVTQDQRAAVWSYLLDAARDMAAEREHIEQEEGFDLVGAIEALARHVKNAKKKNPTDALWSKILTAASTADTSQDDGTLQEFWVAQIVDTARSSLGSKPNAWLTGLIETAALVVRAIEATDRRS